MNKSDIAVKIIEWVSGETNLYPSLLVEDKGFTDLLIKEINEASIEGFSLNLTPIKDTMVSYCANNY